MELKDLLRRVNPHGEMVLDLANETNAQSITWGVKPVYAQRAERRPAGRA